MTGSKPPDLNKFSFYCEGYEQYWAFKGGCNLEDNFKLFEVFHQKLLAKANGSNRVAFFDGNHLVYLPFNFGFGRNSRTSVADSTKAFQSSTFWTNALAAEIAVAAAAEAEEVAEAAEEDMMAAADEAIRSLCRTFGMTRETDPRLKNC